MKVLTEAEQYDLLQAEHYRASLYSDYNDYITEINQQQQQDSYETN